MKNRKGFTLIELVVVMAIVVIFMGIVLTLFLSQNKNFNFVQDSTELQNETRSVLSSMEYDIKVAKNREYNIDISSNERILYKFEVGSAGATEYYGYVYNKSDKSIQKCRISPDGSSYLINSVMATLTENVENIDVSFKDVNTSGTKGDKYDIYLKLSKKKGTQYEETNEEKITVTTRN